jgi:hypothetical protein
MGHMIFPNLHLLYMMHSQVLCKEWLISFLTGAKWNAKQEGSQFFTYFILNFLQALAPSFFYDNQKALYFHKLLRAHPS